MADSYPGKLHVWEGWAPVLRPGPAAAGARGRPAPLADADLADRLYAAEALRPPRSREGPAPFTLQWFLEIEHARHQRQGRWLPRLLEFGKHAGETLLGVGPGLGTDWVQYARHGSAVVVCSPSADHLALVQRNFELRGLAGRFLRAGPAALPLDGASIDVACVGSLLEGTADPQALVEEVYRVLKPGGKVLALAPARYDVGYWGRLLPRIRWGSRGPDLPDPEAPRFSGRGLRRLFARFDEHRVHKRHLRRADTPPVWRWLPPPVLERLVGRVLVLKAFKPLSAALPVPRAA
jgi:SAM-dependent methyltransferase